MFIVAQAFADDSEENGEIVQVWADWHNGHITREEKVRRMDTIMIRKGMTCDIPGCGRAAKMIISGHRVCGVCQKIQERRRAA